MNSQQQLAHLKNMIAKKRATQSIRVSSMLFKLDENRNTAYQYQTQLEEDLTFLERELAEARAQCASLEKDLEEKVDTLMSKVEEAEEEKVRLCTQS